MLKRETIKQAIDAIAAGDPEIGYSLAELFGAGRIDISGEHAADPSAWYFSFDGRAVPVQKINYFNEGLAAIEQPLLVQYGQWARKRSLASAGVGRDYAGAGRLIREAGSSLLLRYELDLARRQLRDEGGSSGGTEAAILLEKLYHASLEKWPCHPDDPQVLFAGAVDSDTSAFFVPFIYTSAHLMQVADLQLPFFSMRFLLTCLRTGTDRNLFACIADGAVAGLVYLRYPRALFSRAMEIKYIASVRRTLETGEGGRPVHRGVGTFMVAGVWLLWKNHLPEVGELLLDSEIQSVEFYEKIGFERRRPYVYVLRRPKGHLLSALAAMTDRSRAIQDHVIGELIRLLDAEVKLVARSKPDDPRRGQALHFIKLCLLCRSRPDLARAAAQRLLRRKGRIPECDALLRLAVQHGRLRLVESQPAAAAPALVFRHAGMQAHLQGVFHLETAGRIKAVDEILQAGDLAGKWKDVPGRPAQEEELKWVHSAGHIARIRSTAGKRLQSFDLDTQTTADSYNAACLAAGGVFSLLDAVCDGRSARGFAAVRPPGHHAEPDKAMGFCLLNNAALGACYLKHVRGMRRVMIVDIDAHHGNGTQAAFFERNDVLYISMHQFPCYPGTGNFGEVGAGAGEGYSVNVPLDKGMGDREFLQVVHRLVDPLACAYEPDMILVSCGFDLYRYDRLANLNGTPAGYAMLTRRLCRIADTVCDGRIAFIMEGGYSLEGIRYCAMRVIQELCGVSACEQDRMDGLLESVPFAALQKAIAIHAKYWPILRK